MLFYADQHYSHKIHHCKSYFYYLFILMATCQELVELGQTTFKIMLIAFWSLAVPKHIA